MRALALSSITLALWLAACAATPQLKPPEERSGPASLTKPFESGRVEAGAYILSAAERALDCKRLKGSMVIIIARLKDAQNRPRPGAVARTIQSGISTVKGRENVMDIDAELERERARLTAFNALLAEKKCATLDLAKELSAAG